MPFKRHPTFNPALNKNSKLWRYMSLPKFISLIQNSNLFMYNLELMSKDDKFEGVLPAGNFIHRQWQAIDDVPENVLTKLKKNIIYHETGDLRTCLEHYKEEQELRIRQTYAHRRSYFINCWHMSEYESLAMWDIYSRKDEGIAIVSSESNFIEAFADLGKDIYGGSVQYVNYDNFSIDVNNVFNSILYKRASYAYEQEYRLVLHDIEVTHKFTPINIIEFDANGNSNIIHSRASEGRTEKEIEEIDPKPSMNINCDLTKLINEIYVSPSAPNWFLDIVINLVDTYNIDIPVKQSELNQDPLR
ncbi:MAG: DUF2971 domain-containing protein [Psychrobacter sp.]|nr:DUF2971 domain-containing protein [Psychrobacter sp.]